MLEELKELFGPASGPAVESYGRSLAERLCEEEGYIAGVVGRFEEGCARGDFPALSELLAGTTEEQIEEFFRSGWTDVALPPYAPPAKSQRRLRLTADSVAALKAHRKRQREERMRISSSGEDHGRVFPSSVGTALDHRNLVRAFKDLLKRASLTQTIRLYDLRHTCATLLLASIALTLGTYSHVLPRMDGGAASAMDEALG